MKAEVGDKVKLVLADKREHIGILMPRPDLLEGDRVVIKLGSGYNIGIDADKIKSMTVVEKCPKKETEQGEVAHDPSLKKVTILHTGGTIASQVDYRTGGVVAKFDPKDFLEMFPELQGVANVDSKLVLQMFSEDMEAEHWKALADAVVKEYKAGTTGVIITHGTDTIHFTAAVLSFMLQNLPIPVLLVGSQRSPDRGSSDAYLNIAHATKFLVETDFAGVGICMHGSTHDDYSYVHLGVQARKMHTSRRDAFRSIHAPPLAKITNEGITYLWDEYPKQKNVQGKLHVAGKFNKNVGLLKIRPSMQEKEFAFYLENYDALVIEGTGLGHMPINANDDYTKHHKKIFDLIKKYANKKLVVMCSQCLYGRTDMNVYSTGRYLLKEGVLNGEDMLPEVAYVKLGWLLGNYSAKQAREMVCTNLVGEITPRTRVGTFLK